MLLLLFSCLLTLLQSQEFVACQAPLCPGFKLRILGELTFPSPVVFPTRELDRVSCLAVDPLPLSNLLTHCVIIGRFQFLMGSCLRSTVPRDCWLETMLSSLLHAHCHGNLWQPEISWYENIAEREQALLLKVTVTPKLSYHHLKWKAEVFSQVLLPWWGLKPTLPFFRITPSGWNLFSVFPAFQLIFPALFHKVHILRIPGRYIFFGLLLLHVLTLWRPKHSALQPSSTRHFSEWIQFLRNQILIIHSGKIWVDL